MVIIENKTRSLKNKGGVLKRENKFVAAAEQLSLAMCSLSGSVFSCSEQMPHMSWHKGALYYQETKITEMETYVLAASLIL